jgi:hypothetical protein
LEPHDVEKPLTPSDLYLGSTVCILSHQFDVLDCDQYTFKYMEANAHQWIYSDLALVLHKIRPKKEVLQRLFLVYPGLGNKFMDVELLAELLDKAKLALVMQETHTLFRAVDSARNGVVKMTKMLKYIMDL